MLSLLHLFLPEPLSLPRLPPSPKLSFWVSLSLSLSLSLSPSLSLSLYLSVCLSLPLSLSLSFSLTLSCYLPKKTNARGLNYHQTKAAFSSKVYISKGPTSLMSGAISFILLSCLCLADNGSGEEDEGEGASREREREDEPGSEDTDTSVWSGPAKITEEKSR